MEINMNGNTNDSNYRYTMPKLKVTVAGKGNGIYTIFNNLENVCKSINHPVEVVFNYLASVTGSNCILERNTLTGSHNPDDLVEIILEYIKHLVMCPKCNIPETIPILVGTKKNASINLSCSACKNESNVKMVNKRISKGIDIIIKYLKSGKTWMSVKGNMVSQLIDHQDESNGTSEPKSDIQADPSEINPFDSL